MVVVVVVVVVPVVVLVVVVVVVPVLVRGCGCGCGCSPRCGAFRCPIALAIALLPSPSLPNDGLWSVAGKVERLFLAQNLQRAFGLDLSPNDLYLLAAKCDPDGDGLVSYQDFICAMQE